MSELFIGLMSGTSVDAIDAVLMDFSKSNTHIVSSYSQSIDSSLRKNINSLISKNQLPKDFEKLDKQFANASSKAVEQLLNLSSTNADQITAIGSHGQTVFHDPKGTPAVSIQIGDPQHIANTTHIPTIGNLRQADIDAGGEGAPLASAYHAATLQSPTEERIVVNLGGIANITKLPKDKMQPIIGFDTGPASTLMDAWTQQHLNKPFDKDGAWAQSGNANTTLLESMLKDNYFSKSPPKSTGREYFNLEWLQHFLDAQSETIPVQDIQATLLSLTVYSVADSIETWCPEGKKILLCGGGSENSFLVQKLEKTLQGKIIQNTNDYNVPTNWMEAMAFAWLAKQHFENTPGNIPSVTGADMPVKLGNLYKPK